MVEKDSGFRFAKPFPLPRGIRLYFDLVMVCGGNYLVGLIHNKVGLGLERGDSLVLTIKYFKPESVHLLLHPDDLVDLCLLVGKINKNPEIDIGSINGIQAIKYQQVYFTEISNKLIYLFRDKVNAWYYALLFFLEIPYCLSYLNPVVFINTDLVKSFIPSPFLTQ